MDSKNLTFNLQPVYAICAGTPENITIELTSNTKTFYRDSVKKLAEHLLANGFVYYKAIQRHDLNTVQVVFRLMALKSTEGGYDGYIKCVEGKTNNPMATD